MWNVILHRLVLKEDFKKIEKPARKLILKAIYKKLSRDPENYGSPLLRSYKGYWKLRVGDYRVVYKIVKGEVLVIVIKVGIRKDDKIYRELIYRLNKL
ncbi:MAG: type II toxin-antitoxin system RelE/ParE family toxin [Candidatus Omnitrophica bacterium]|nr:type II toxin-antitoxin system RelE/ParE family toxin [Candidatus Omnitrophota bacterium]